MVLSSFYIQNKYNLNIIANDKFKPLYGHHVKKIKKNYVKVQKIIQLKKNIFIK